MSVMQDKKAGLKDSKKGAKKEKVGDPLPTAPGSRHPPCHTACLRQNYVWIVIHYPLRRLQRAVISQGSVSSFVCGIVACRPPHVHVVTAMVCFRVRPHPFLQIGHALHMHKLEEKGAAQHAKGEEQYSQQEGKNAAAGAPPPPPPPPGGACARARVHINPRICLSSSPSLVALSLCVCVCVCVWGGGGGGGV